MIGKKITNYSNFMSYTGFWRLKISISWLGQQQHGLQRMPRKHMRNLLHRQFVPLRHFLQIKIKKNKNTTKTVTAPPIAAGIHSSLTPMIFSDDKSWAGAAGPVETMTVTEISIPACCKKKGKKCSEKKRA